MWLAHRDETVQQPSQVGSGCAEELSDDNREDLSSELPSDGDEPTLLMQDDDDVGNKS
jgi:hypothetical protein